MGTNTIHFFDASTSQDQSRYSDDIDRLLQKQAALQQTYRTLLSQLNAIKEERARVERALRQAMSQHSTSALITATGQTVLVTPSQSRVVIDSPENIPLDYVHFSMRRQLDRHRIKTDLAQGKKIAGAHLVIDEAVEVTSTPAKEDAFYPK